MPSEAEARSRQVVEAARETEWRGASFLRELFLGCFRLDLVHPWHEAGPLRPQFQSFYDALKTFLVTHVDPVAIDETNLGGHTLVFQGRFDLPLLSAAGSSRHAEVLASRGQLDDALSEARIGVALTPDRMQGHLTLAQVLAKRKEVEKKRAPNTEKPSAWQKYENSATTGSPCTLLGRNSRRLILRVNRKNRCW